MLITFVFAQMFPGQVLITHRTYVHGKLVKLTKEKDAVRKSLMRARVRILNVLP